MDRHRFWWSILARFLFLSSGSISGGSGCGLMSVSVDKFDTDLFGEGELNLLAGRFSKSSNALGNSDGGVFDGGNGDGALFDEVFAANDGEVDGFVDTGLDGAGVFDFDGDVDGGDNWHVVGGGLSDLLAVVVSVSSVSVSTISMVSGLADGDHLDIGLLLEGDLNGFGGGGLGGLFVMVGADFLGDDLNGDTADGTGDGVGEVNIDDDLDGKINILAGGGNGGGADLSDFSHITDGTVVFGFLVSVTTISGGMMTVSGGSMVTISGSSMVGSSSMVTAIGGGGVAGEGQSEGEESEDCECLHVCCSACRV